MPEIRWTIDAGQIILIGILLPAIIAFGRFLWGMRDDLKWLMELLKNFPPHLHTAGGTVVYPKGMTPDGQDS